METMRLYYIMDIKNTIYDTNIPLGIFHICPSIYGCLCANKFPDNYPADTDFRKGIIYAIFMADIPIEDVFDMDEKKHPDAWFTGEKFISGNHKFTKIGEIVLKVQEYIDDTYCRFTICGVDETPVKYIKDGPVVYGSSFNFSFIGFNPNSKRNTNLIPGVINNDVLEVLESLGKDNLRKENFYALPIQN